MPDLGDTVNLHVEVRDSTGALGNATSIAYVVTLPDGSTTSPSGTNTSTGTYDAPFSTTLVGLHSWKATATGGAAGTAQVFADSFNVNPAASVPLVGLSELKLMLNVRNSDGDEQMRAYLIAASAIVERESRIWRRTTVTETRDGGLGVIYLRSLPAIAVTSVTESGAAATGYSLDVTTGALYRNVYGTGWWLYGVGNVVITYTAGTGIVPEAVQLATLLQAQHMWTQQRGGSNLPRQAGLDDAYPQAGATIPRRVRELLAPYRLHAVA